MDQGRSTGTLQPGDAGLRERIASHLDSTGGRDALIDHGEVEPTGDKDQKTFGRTPDGKGTLSFWCHLLICMISISPRLYLRYLIGAVSLSPPCR